jgi:hypothetical protein
MSKNKKPKSEATPATHDPRMKRIIADADLIIAVAQRMKDQTLDSMTDEQTGELANVFYMLLRDLNCHASITSPQEVIDEADARDLKLTSKQAKQVCENLQDDDWIGEQYYQTLRDLIDGYEAGDLK